MWTFGRSNKQAGPPVKKVLELPSLRTLELTGDLIGHSGAVQVWCHVIINGQHLDKISYLFIHVTISVFLLACPPDVCEFWGEGSGNMFYRPSADCMEEQRERVSPPQSRPLQETGGERRALTPPPTTCQSLTQLFMILQNSFYWKVLKRGGMYLFPGVVISLSLRFMDVSMYM